ncbi:MAG: ribonuclease [Oscillospiraceae bacterium]|nr:ribonuclease [Oscillospiraceae bacterium]
MKRNFGFIKIIVLILAFFFCVNFYSCSFGYKYIDDSQSVSDTELNEQKPLTSFNEVAYYIKENGKLPDNFITKSEARALGWDANKGNLAEVAPGKSIGGDVFNNNEGLLPKKSGRIYYECDINYVSGFRGADRLIFSNDGLIFKTVDHYQTFTEIN